MRACGALLACLRALRAVRARVLACVSERALARARVCVRTCTVPTVPGAAFLRPAPAHPGPLAVRIMRLICASRMPACLHDSACHRAASSLLADRMATVKSAAVARMRPSSMRRNVCDRHLRVACGLAGMVMLDLAVLCYQHCLSVLWPHLVCLACERSKSPPPLQIHSCLSLLALAAEEA